MNIYTLISKPLGTWPSEEILAFYLRDNIRDIIPAAAGCVISVCELGAG